MPPRRSYKADNFSGLLHREGTNEPVYKHKDSVAALGKLARACVSQEASVYFRGGKDGSITCRIYAGDDKYEEVLRPGDDIDYLAEQMIEALYGQQVVAECRRAATPGVAERPAAARNKAQAGSESGD